MLATATWQAKELAEINPSPQTLATEESACRVVQLDWVRASPFSWSSTFMRSGWRTIIHLLAAIPLVGNRFGWMGVDLFFVLSGFLVGDLLIQEITRTVQTRSGLYASRERFYWLLRQRAVLAVLSVSVFAIALFAPINGGVYLSTVGYTVNYVGFAALMLLTLRLPRFAAPQSVLSGGGWIGHYSYRIYLWHLAVRKRLPHLPTRQPAAVAWFVLLVAEYAVDCARSSPYQACGISRAALA